MYITKRRDCTAEERRSLMDYLSLTPVAWIVEVVGSGAKVSKGEIDKTSELGNLKTIWKDLGGIRRANEYSVREVVKILGDPLCTDAKSREKIQQYKRLYGLEKLRLTITLLERNNDLMIIDGNKSAVACYEYGKDHGLSNLRLPVYIITLE